MNKKLQVAAVNATKNSTRVLLVEIGADNKPDPKGAKIVYETADASEAAKFTPGKDYTVSITPVK